MTISQVAEVEDLASPNSVAELIVSNVLNLNEILQPQVVFIPRVLRESKVWRRMVQVQVTPALPFIRDLACHIVIQPIGRGGDEIGNLTQGGQCSKQCRGENEIRSTVQCYE